MVIEQKPTSTSTIVEDKQEIYHVNDTKPFTEDQLLDTWIKYANENLTNNPRLSSIFTTLKPTLKDNYVIEIGLNNDLQLEEIEKIKPAIMNFLRKELSNEKIDLVTLITDAPVQNKRLFNDREKFEHLAQKNPNVLKLKQIFGLEIGN